MIGAQGATADAAAVAVEAAWHVDSQFGAVQIIGLPDPEGLISRDVALQTHAEQPVDDKTECLRTGDFVQDCAAAFAPARPRARRIGWQAGWIGMADDKHAEALLA